jgi:microcompartment protein CcmL/EutN
MPQLSLGTIEVLGLPAAVEAADVALKTADVKLIGYETTDGMGMVAVKIEGQVSAVQAAVAAASAAAGRVSKVFATSVIARPSEQLPPVVYTAETVGYTVQKAAAPTPVPAPEPVPGPVPAAPVAEASSSSAIVTEVAEPTPEPLVEPAETIAAPVTEVPAGSASVKPRTTSRTRSTKK